MDWKTLVDRFGSWLDTLRPQPVIVSPHPPRLTTPVKDGAVAKPTLPSIAVVSQPVKIETPKDMLTPPWMVVAKELMGTKETPGSANNKVILEWAKELGLARSYTADSIPWCGLFAGYAVHKSGFPIVKTPLWAKGHLEKPNVPIKIPGFGAIMVFSRTGGGHVGFYVSEDANYYHILGGNQSDAVNVTRVAKANCVGYRWPAGAERYYRAGRIQAKFSQNVPLATKLS